MKKKVLKTTLKVLSYLIDAILLLVILLLAFVFISNRAGVKYPTLGPYQMYMVLSDSMAPTFREGDAVIIKKASVNDLKAGDVITFAIDSAKDVLVTHRIAELEQSDTETVYITKGDNNDVKDQNKVNSDDVIGKYVFHIPMLGFLFNLLRKYPMISIFAFIAVLSFIGGSLIVTSIRDRRSYREKNSWK